MRTSSRFLPVQVLPPEPVPELANRIQNGLLNPADAEAFVANYVTNYVTESITAYVTGKLTSMSMYLGFVDAILSAMDLILNNFFYASASRTFGKSICIYHRRFYACFNCFQLH